MQSLSIELEHWLHNFADAVRNQDFAAGKALFHQDVVSFGTVCVRSDSLNNLVDRQWKVIWTSTKWFNFDYASALAAVEANQAVIISNWYSTGFDRQGKAFQRQGRSSIVLKQDEGQWKAIHTHLSINPQ